MPVEVVTAAQRLSIIDLELYKGAAARVRGWTEITEIIGFPCTGGSKGASPDRRRFKFQLGGPSLHIIRPRTERHSYLISLRLAGFPCALSTAIPRRSAPIQSRGQIYACMPQIEAQPHPTYRAARRLGLPLSFSSFPSSFTGIGQPAT